MSICHVTEDRRPQRPARPHVTQDRCRERPARARRRCRRRDGLGRDHALAQQHVLHSDRRRRGERGRRVRHRPDTGPRGGHLGGQPRRQPRRRLAACACASRTAAPGHRQPLPAARRRPRPTGAAAATGVPLRRRRRATSPAPSHERARRPRPSEAELAKRPRRWPMLDARPLAGRTRGAPPCGGPRLAPRSRPPQAAHPRPRDKAVGLSPRRRRRPVAAPGRRRPRPPEPVQRITRARVCPLDGVRAHSSCRRGSPATIKNRRRQFRTRSVRVSRDRDGDSRRAPAPDGAGALRWCRGDPASGHLMILVTRPAPTVRPPSRMAKRRPSSMAMGWMSSTAISVLSPGMTISVPSGRCTTPVTSVVRK